MRAAGLTNRLVSLGVLLLLAAFVLLTPLGARGVTGGQATFCLGFILLFGYYLARVLDRFRLPSITSYILVGLLCGPFGLDLLSRDAMAGLDRLEDVALAIIALIAGGELRVAMLRARRAALVSVMVGQIVFSMLAAVAVVFLLEQHLGGIDAGSGRAAVAVGLLFGLVVVARSPATTIGVVTELRAKGPMTEVLVGVTVLLDVVVLFLAALIIPSAETLLSPERSFSLAFAQSLTVEVVGSVAAGLFFGLLLRVYMRWVIGYLPLFLLGVGLVGSVVCHHYHLEPLLAFMIAGFYVENFSSMGKQLIDGLERSAFPVYVVFFAIAGASIDLAALRAMWLLAAVLVVARALAFYAGVFAASRVVADLRPFAHSMWSGFLAQAGVTIGIAALVARRFAWGAEFETIALAVVAINQLIGPVALKALIERKGEAGGMDRSG